ncbi:MAG TPA: fasciclin domain-containing protein [Steroidobacteraceae bacterium]|nr:fasciclin domain-containing protein [Steroidobacteraceae bacterium]
MDQVKSVPNGAGARNTTTAPSKSIVDTMIDAGRFTTLTAAIDAAGLSGELAAKGPFTVFAPTDEAFRKLPAGAYDRLLKDAGKLKAILNYHVVSGHLMAADLKSGEVPTAQGTSLTVAVSSSDVRVNEARVTQADAVATNGVVHAIDAVILPKNWQLLAAAA